MPSRDRLSPMRILTVSAFFEKHGGGVEIVAGALARALALRGHDCHVTGADFDELPTDKLLSSVPLPAHDPLERHFGLPMPIPTRQGRRLLALEVAAADAVIIHDSLYASSILSAREATRLGKPWILIQHIGAIPYSSALLRAALASANRVVTQRMLNNASQAIFISDIVRQNFDGITYRRTPKLMFNGVDKNLFHFPEEGEKALAKAELGLNMSSKLNLLFVGRFVEKKGLSALRELAIMRPDFDVVLVGSGPIDPAIWGLPNVRLLGRRSREELARLYHACDALVLPSVGEGYPLVVQEALVSGLPVYCGIDSAAADPKAASFLHGILVDPNNPKATAERIDQAIQTHPPSSNVAASAYASKHYDWDANASEIEAMIAAISA